MENKFILELIEAFNTSKAVSLKIQQGETSISLKKEGAYSEKKAFENCTIYQGGSSENICDPVTPKVVEVKSSATENSGDVQSKENVSSSGETSEISNVIKSPIVGTFYRAPSPDAPVYCEVGKLIKKGQPICILEAMKMMNTLEAEYDCVIEEILVDNGELVEFNQPIFKVKKA